MGKKKSVKSAVSIPVTVRINKQTYRQIEELYQASRNPDVTSFSGMASALIEEAINIRSKPPEPVEESLTRLLDHFEQRMTQRLIGLNANLREATGMLLTPKPKVNAPPNPQHLIESEEDARSWVDALFRPISD